MARAIVTYAEAVETIGILSSLEPRPNATNLRLLQRVLADALKGITSFQSEEFGFRGMVESAPIYALRTNIPWVECPDPGHHRALDGGNNFTTTQQRDLEVVFQAEKGVHTSQQNVKRATLTAMNAAVSNKYKRAMDGNIGVLNYKQTESPRDLIEALLCRYGQPSAAEKENNKKAWSQLWNPTDPIEDMIQRLEECYTTALIFKPVYTIEQMIDKALRSIKTTGLYTHLTIERGGFLDVSQTWPEFKSHFVEAYGAWLTNGVRNNVLSRYQGTHAAREDDSGSIISMAGGVTLQLLRV